MMELNIIEKFKKKFINKGIFGMFNELKETESESEAFGESLICNLFEKTIIFAKNILLTGHIM